LWDVESGREIRSFGPFSYDIFAIAFTPDQKFGLVAVHGDKPSVHVLDLRSGQIVKSLLGDGEDSNGMAFSPDGTKLLIATAVRTSTNDDTSAAKLYEVGTWAELKTYRAGGGKHAGCVVFSPNGKLFAIAGSWADVMVINVENGKNYLEDRP
jgi:WD40 repeat protein